MCESGVSVVLKCKVVAGKNGALNFISIVFYKCIQRKRKQYKEMKYFFKKNNFLNMQCTKNFIRITWPKFRIMKQILTSQKYFFEKRLRFFYRNLISLTQKVSGAKKHKEAMKSFLSSILTLVKFSFTKNVCSYIF